MVISGTVTVTESSDWSCCFSPGPPNSAGTYGPEGFPGALNVGLEEITIHTVGSGTGAVEQTDTIDVRGFGLAGGTLHVNRAGISGGSSCTGMCTCPSGPCSHYVAGKWDLSSSQTIVVNAITDSLEVTTSPSSGTVGRNVTFTAQARDGASISTLSGFSWSWAADSGTGHTTACGATNPCTTSVKESGTMTVHAKVLGMAKTATVHVRVYCNTGDSLLNSPRADTVLTALLAVSPPFDTSATARLEAAGSVDSNTTTGRDSTDWTDGSDACNSAVPVFTYSPWVPRLMAHTHPFNPGETTPTTHCANNGGQTVQPGPSTKDTTYFNSFLRGLRTAGYTGPAPEGVILDPQNVYTFDSTGAYKTIPRIVTGSNACKYP